MNKHLSDYRIILWDFDGVILDSNEVREYGFRKVLRGYPEDQVDKLIRYHNQNGGLSRYVKFRYFFEIIRKESISDKEVNVMAQSFSHIMLELLPKQENLIAETVNFIKHKSQEGIEQHIVSGSDQSELRKLCKKLGIAGYFSTIQGSPTPKTRLVAGIMNQLTLDKQKVCLIGDSINDYEAAHDNSISFFAYNNSSLKEVTDSYIDSFSKYV